MKLSEIAKLHIKPGSTAYDDMVLCDIISRLQQKEIKSEVYQKRVKKYNKKKGKR